MALHNFSLAKTCGVIGYGAVFWGLGVLTIRHGGTYMFQTNLSRSLSMAATVPASYAVIRLTEALFSLNAQDTLAAMVLGTGAASILDGIAHTWFPSAYEDPELQKKNPLAACTISRYGSGWLLFFVGAALTMLVFM
ncbi:unnamed protein product [Rotaria sp. Silwood1]|nr:unnamed protein product [Rotaria sp. Silwood1]CAF1674901.1 unnamed protein product [Rotaria sp. Silwood1]CAF3429050.1 unnamed protein product [Rotaria sp. Silwood1]CAF3893218.1 unnamed protein product [Rotaria sp. Silwood1]CAF3915024.1 unnamed protein product [Rotaria sp. Silwood1]